MNEGDTFGTATGGATPPQNGNSFDRPTGVISSGVTGAITSAGAASTADATTETGDIPTVSTAGVSNSSRFFGGRSRFSRHNTASAVSPQQANYAAAQNIAANPNTPQFFSDAVVANTPVPPAPKRKSKKGLFIGIGAAVVVAVVAVVAVVLVGAGDNFIGGTQEEQLSELTELIDSSRDGIEYFETIHSAASNMEYGLGSTLIERDGDPEETVRQIENYLLIAKELRNSLDRYDIEPAGVDDNGKGIKEYILDLEEVLDDRAESYEDYSVFLPAILRAISSDGDIEKIQTTKNILSDDDYSAIRESLERYFEKEKKFKENFGRDGCSGGYLLDNVCYSELAIQSQLNDLLDEDPAISKTLYSISSKSSNSKKPLAIMNKIRQLIVEREQE